MLFENSNVQRSKKSGRPSQSSHSLGHRSLYNPNNKAVINDGLGIAVKYESGHINLGVR